MSERKDGGPAFPQVQCCDEDGRLSPAVIGGMSLRDYFAAKAMQSRISNSEIGIDETPKEIAEAAYAQADAMLQEREQ